MNKLTKKEEAFVHHYLSSGNAAAAARAAGYSAKTAKETGYKLKKRLADYIAEQLEEQLDDLKIVQLQALGTLRYYATAPPSADIAPKDQINAAKELLSYINPKTNSVTINNNNSVSANYYDSMSDDELDALIESLK